MTLPELPSPEPASQSAAEPEYVAPDDPAGPDYAERTNVQTFILHGLTVETIGKPLPF